MDAKKSWFGVTITVETAAAEAVEFAFNELDALGTEINNLGKTKTETLDVVGYFNELPDDENLQNHLREALRIYDFAPNAIRQIDSRRIGDTDWLFEWKKHWKPTETAKFIVTPSWENVADSDKIVVRIEPSMAFGTGTHETTRLCLQAIEENFRAGESFFDVGTGTGILSIGAAKLFDGKAENFSACDTDTDSIRIAEENAELNKVENINFYVGSINEKIAEYDFVCANLTADVIVPILPLLIEKSKRILVLSGILREQEGFIKNELERLQITNPQIEHLGEWIAVLIEREV